MTPLQSRRWYLAKNKQKLGPFTDDQMKQMASDGQIQPTDMVLEVGRQKWQQALSAEVFLPIGDTEQKWGSAHYVEGPLKEGNSVRPPARADAVRPLGFQDYAKAHTPASPQLLDSRSLVACEYCKHPIATAANVCPGCGAPNKWVHPEIQRFLNAIGTFVRPFNYGHNSTRLWGFTDPATAATNEFKGSLARAITCVVGSFVSFLIVANCAGYLPSILLVILVLAVPGLIIAAIWLFINPGSISIKPGEFAIDFSRSPPLWSSNNDDAWAEIKAFFFPNHADVSKATMPAGAPGPSSNSQNVRNAPKLRSLRWLVMVVIPCFLACCMFPMGGYILWDYGGSSSSISFGKEGRARRELERHLRAWQTDDRQNVGWVVPPEHMLDTLLEYTIVALVYDASNDTYDATVNLKIQRGELNQLDKFSTRHRQVRYTIRWIDGKPDVLPPRD